MSLTKDILIDDVKLENAAVELEKIANEMTSLIKNINGLLDDLSKGFNTPAGRKFISTCRNGLLLPIEEQTAVINHVATNLKMANNAYRSVFEDYKSLNNKIQ